MERKLRIGIDIDGVLRDNVGIMVDIYTLYFNEKLRYEDVKQYNVEETFPRIPRELHMKASQWFFQEHSKEIFEDASAYPYVTEDIKALQEFADVYIITYQKSYKNKMQALKWLEEHDINPKGIIFLKNKELFDCDVLIDDNDWNFNDSHASVGILIDAPYNIDRSLKDIQKTGPQIMMRCSNLHEFVNLSEELINEYTIIKKEI